MRDFSGAEKAIGYTFKDKQLLEEALTHTTYAHLHGGKDNERLEYFGDAVLQFIVTEKQYLLSREDEGVLTERRQGVVCEEALLDAVDKMGLTQWLRHECGEKLGKKTVSSLYESVLAAVYLDGGMQAAKAFVEAHPPAENSTRNYKGDLQECLQKQGYPLPEYSFEKQGKDNDPTFRCVALAQGKRGEGEGKTKRAAEQAAAKALLSILTNRK
jgi:ribonuclease-3